MTTAHVLGLMAGGSGALLLDFEPRGTGMVARLELDGHTYRVQVDALTVA
jgi:hypothetical protein